MKTKFVKMQGTGNDFIIFAQRREQLSLGDEQLVSLCARKTGIGSDGMMFVWKEHESAKWYWQFYNEDASLAEFCGNGARCIVRYISDHEGVAGEEVEWHSLQGHTFRGTWWETEKEVELKWPMQQVSDFPLSPQELLLLKNFISSEPGLYYKCLKVGVPHLCLVHQKHWSPAKRAELIELFRKEIPEFFKKANITWISAELREVVTFERGVEAETLACGSGALSAFLAWQDMEPVSECRFQFPGGPLSVGREGDELTLSGDAHYVFTGECEL